MVLYDRDHALHPIDMREIAKTNGYTLGKRELNVSFTGCLRYSIYHTGTYIPSMLWYG
jgi:hypothetical protein